MPQQSFPCEIIRKNPIFQSIGVLPRDEARHQRILLPLGIEQFAGAKTFHPLRHTLPPFHAHQELPGGDVQKGQTVPSRAVTDRREPIVVPVIHDTIAERYAGRDHFRDPTFHDGLGQLGILQLIADRYSMPRADQFGQVGIQGMVRETCQGHFTGRAVVAFGEGDPEDLRGPNSVGGEGLVEIAHTEEQQGVGVLPLDPLILLHQRCFAPYAFGHLPSLAVLFSPVWKGKLHPAADRS